MRHNQFTNGILQLDDEVREDMPAKVIWGVAEENPPPIHWHKNIEINFLIDGEWNINTDGNRKSINGEQIVIVNSREIHRIAWQDFNKRNNLVIVFYYDFLKRYVPDLDDIRFVLSDSIMKKSLLYIHLLELKEIYEVLYRKENKPSVGVVTGELIEIKIKSILYFIMYDLFQECGVRKKERKRKCGKKYEDRVKKVCNYLEDNYKENIKLAHLAEVLCVSKAHCARLFKEYTGATIFEYLSEVRLFHAYQLLITTSKTMTDIAMDTGFSDFRAFCSYFVKVYKVTPMEYRKQIKRER